MGECQGVTAMILLYTDFGLEGPYVGLLHRVIAGRVAATPIVDLMHDAPRFRPREAGLLLDALAPGLPRRCIVVAVVDPGVGSSREALVARVADRWYVGPDNGLLAPLLRGDDARAWRLPAVGGASPSFHGRDVFAPAAASLAVGRFPAGVRAVDDWVDRDAPAGEDRVVYIDGFGNAMTGRRADSVPPGRAPVLAGRALPRARTFSDREVGEAFWYENAFGLVEIAVNQGSAAAALGLAVGDPVTFAAE